ncbi:hypothetical protein [Paracraurococcus lichenis]|uniref:N-acetyltransferase domain-containing protein n=1 Tax=Paracraurococcus lichenis TaxID=3064888 RepID=A0ABT9E966_9PROT|nr:hypothetical protein [Paracraurococcus sp. LOR1-02]MDO9712728.1 hypothetical protein [Paracraurococcus sp. LOR1-02]
MSLPIEDAGRITIHVVPTASLSEDQWETLYGICLIWFTGYGLDFFREECGKSRHCILMHDDADGPIVGFANLYQQEAVIAGRRVGLFYTGHCFALKEHWGSSALIRGLIALMGREMRGADPDITWYWHYSAIGFRSYRYMPLLFRHFIPQVDHAADPFDRALRDRLGEEIFGDVYEPGSGLIDWNCEGYALSSLASEISDAKLANSTISVIDQLNPRWAEGVEILCQARMSTDNLTRLSSRWIKAEL